MSSAVLTPADHEHFVQHGWVVVRHVASPEATAAAVAALEQGRFAGTVGAADYRPVSSATLAACYGPRAQAAMSELFGEPYSLAPTFAGIDMPRPHEPTKPWSIGGHVDDDYPTLMPAGWALGCFLFLTPVRPHGGAFIYYDGSANRCRAAALQRLSCLKEVSSRPEFLGPATEFLAQPGDMLLFHHLQGHSGSPNIADPVTRHALLSRHHPSGRVVPGDKPFAQMSTIEKANSTRHLRECLGVAAPSLCVGADVTFGPHARAACASHFDGRVWLLTVDPAHPHVITPWTSDDFAHWQPVTGGATAASVIDPGIGVIDSIRLYAERGNVRLFAGNEANGGATAMLSSDDMIVWQREGQSQARAVAGHYTTDYGSKAARGFVLFELAADGQTMAARCAAKWADLHTASVSVTACRPPSGTRIVDFEHAPTYGEARFALVADVVGVDGAVSPFAVVDRDSVAFTGEWAPLAWTAPSPPRSIRVFGRARDYWLVTYLRAGHADGAADQRVCWGVIDWEKQPLTLREVASAADMRAALQFIGLM